jgi:hypothetical protein
MLTIFWPNIVEIVAGMADKPVRLEVLEMS